MLIHDQFGFGIVENATWLVLIPGIIAGFIAFSQRRYFPDARLGWTTLLCTFACIFFAGEEISWGQHFFGWEAGDTFREINKQHETNLHNISSWLNQKPRALVEWGVMISGLILPLRRWLRNIRTDESDFSYWFWPTNIVVPTALLFFFLECSYLYQKATLKVIPGWMFDREVKEYYVALFLSLYLISICLRLRGRAKQVSVSSCQDIDVSPSSSNDDKSVL